VAAPVGEAASVATHLIAYPELWAALARAQSMGRVDPSELGGVLVEAERRWASMDVIAVTEPLVRRAADLALH
jgi:hypothetical protein